MSLRSFQLSILFCKVFRISRPICGIPCHVFGISCVTSLGCGVKVFEIECLASSLWCQSLWDLMSIVSSLLRQRLWNLVSSLCDLVSKSVGSHVYSVKVIENE